ncbi:serine hydrolase [Thalassobaculum sp. OXR-137]|uniref:serine hydrolase domain-containing protein n=1 Tax=Thalassobaculum sp. OXR-137 TaxID=3100173 RepID=UPI002AC9B10B|nr:serine hydrolase [Thalassobaculum sp. OXR-137]WPZ33799.1 serine hydrolase [Thalassobaculum sp. OXR-137]
MSKTRLMQGFPPSPETQVDLSNWRTAPYNRWAFHHVREIVPSADIPNDPESVAALPTASRDLDQLAVEGAGSLTEFLAATDTDGIVILHDGHIVFESYANGMDAFTPHILMSVSKSLLGLIAGILIEDGSLDPNAFVADYVPEIADTAYKGASVRHLLDMRAGVEFDENYLATSGAIIAYRKAQNWNPLDPGERPSDLRSFYASMTAPDGPHNGRFHYVSPNTDLLGWVIERASGQRYADLMSDRLWRPMGAERSAYITVDRLGAPRCAGGVCTTVRDLARVGQLLLQGGSRDGQQIIPAEWIDDLISGGDPDAWNEGDFVELFRRAPMRYRSKWYVQDGPAPLLFGFGVHGQNLFVDRTNQVVIAKVSSQAAPIDEERNDLTLRAVRAIVEALRG